MTQREMKIFGFAICSVCCEHKECVELYEVREQLADGESPVKICRDCARKISAAFEGTA